MESLGGCPAMLSELCKDVRQNRLLALANLKGTTQPSPVHTDGRVDRQSTLQHIHFTRGRLQSAEDKFTQTYQYGA
jgi:hypothetical protein